MDECLRLRQSLENVIKSKDTFADPQELQIIESKFQQRDQIIQEMQIERNALLTSYNELENQYKTALEQTEKLQDKVKKANEAKDKAAIKQR